jgi:C6 transcription factor Pro1
VVGRQRIGIDDDDLITKFACNVLVVIDILWSASKRRRPLLAGDPTSIAAFNMVDSTVPYATGSQLWVFHYIAEITLLRMWKLDQAASHSLNIKDLARKAATIGTAIQEQRRKATSLLGCQANKDVLLVTDIYAAAAQIYLNVVISGAFPEVSDIQQAVEDTIDALKRLSNAVLMRRLAWPICVAASLAEPRHEAFFNALETGAQGDQEGCMSVLRGLIVARECRKLRQDSSAKGASFDWMDALDSLGRDWILF